MNKKSIIYIIIAMLVLPLGILFSACGEKQLSEAIITIEVENKTYDGTAIVAEATASNNAAVTLQYKQTSANDNTYSAVAPTDAGSYTVKATINAVGDYKAGSKTKNFEILPKPVAVNWTAPANLVYTKTAKVPTVTVNAEDVIEGDTCEINATLKAENDNVNAGTFAYVATLDNSNYTIAEQAEKSYTITPKPVTVNWTAPANLVYTKTAKVPTVAVEAEDIIDGDTCEINATLKAENDNVNAGTFAYVATLGNENYTIAEDAEHSFTITKATYSAVQKRYKRQDEENWRDNQNAFDMGQVIVFGVYCEGGEEIEGEVVYSIYEEYTTGAATIEGNVITPTRYGMIYIKAQIEESNNYYAKEASGAQGLNVRGLQPVEGEQYEVPTGLTATYGQTLGQIALPQNFTWYNDTATAVGNVGEREWQVVFTPPGDDYYIYVQKVVTVTITVNKANAVFEAPTNIDIAYGTVLAGSTGLPEGFTWSGSNTANAYGKHTYAATYNPDIANYNQAAGQITVTVVPTGLTANYATFVGDIELPADCGFTWKTPDAAVGGLGNHEFVLVLTADSSEHNVNVEVVKAPNRILIQHTQITYDGLPLTAEKLGLDTLGDGEITIEYKEKGEDDNTYSTTAPTDVGYYTVRVTVAEGSNYLAAVEVQDIQIVAAA